MKAKYVCYLFLLGVIFNVLILKIDSPLWDDWTLEGLSFDNIALQFKGNGLYFSGLAHLHYFINMIDGEEVWFGRMLSLICITSAPLLLFFILTNLSFSEKEAFQIAMLALSIPLFGSAFGQIVLPYLICFNFFLISTFLIVKFLENGSKPYFFLIAASLFLFLSFITNSLIFFSLPVIYIILIYHFFKTGEIKKTVFVAIWLIGIVALFFLFKSRFLVPQEGSPYSLSGYNSFGIVDLVYDGPLRTLKYLIDYPILFLKDVLNVFLSSFNVLLFLFLSILTAVLFYNFKGEEKTSRKSPLKLYIYLIIGFLLLIAAIYPYSVVGKSSDSLFSYNERHNLLMPIGIALGLFSILHFFVKPPYIKYGFAVIVPFFLVLRLNIFGYFVVKADIQEKVGDKLKSYIIDHKLSNQSILFINETNSLTQLDDWSFYEYGGIIRSLELLENKVFVNKNFVKEDELGKPKLDIKGATHLFLKSPNYGIGMFDTSNYEVVRYRIDIEDKSNSYIAHALFDTLNVKFDVIN